MPKLPLGCKPLPKPALMHPTMMTITWRPSQVRHRCPCANKAVCGAEEDLVLRLAREGKIPTNYILQ